MQNFHKLEPKFEHSLTASSPFLFLGLCIDDTALKHTALKIYKQP